MKTIVVIDDDHGIRNALSDWFALKGFNSITAADGVTGLNLTQFHQPDLVICDFRMPIMNGLETLKALRNDSAIKHIPFWLATAELDLDHFSEGAQLGASGFLKKPFEVADVSRTLSCIA
ncbi:MAG: response regulator [Cyanobacteria bacterium]|nr:response regulator [Cyanobacteriota bacterium]MDA0866254.1 response regulator [Cyanobacteriota bacterium]